MIFAVLATGNVFIFASNKINIAAESSSEIAKKFPELPNAYHNMEYIWEIENLPKSWESYDRNQDGKIDFARLDIGGQQNGLFSQREINDTNNDGVFDTFFYFNAESELVFHTMDSNFDRQIDYWIEYGKNNKIKRIQRDLDFDGYVDKEFNF